jgi:hypothetical protein
MTIMKGTLGSNGPESISDRWWMHTQAVQAVLSCEVHVWTASLGSSLP